MELNEKWKLTTQNNAYLWEGNQISKQNRYPCLEVLQYKVGREGREDALVDRELGLLHLDPNVSEGVLAVEYVEAGQHHVGVRATAEHELLLV